MIIVEFWEECEGSIDFQLQSHDNELAHVCMSREYRSGVQICVFEKKDDLLYVFGLLL